MVCELNYIMGGISCMSGLILVNPCRIFTSVIHFIDDFYKKFTLEFYYA